MKRLVTFLALLAFTALTNAAKAEGSYLLKPYNQRPGTVVSINSTSASLNGKMIIVEGAKKTEGIMTVQRTRVIQRRVVTSGKSTGISYKVIKDTSFTNNELGYEKNSRNDSTLTGKTAVGFQDTMGLWHLYLENQTATNREAVDLVELEAYSNRQMFVPRRVKIGESWDVNPAFFRHIVLRDLGAAQLRATMTLKAVQNINGEPTAVLVFKLKTSGTKGDTATQSASTATITATGTMLISLDTMLDRELNLKGTLQTTYVQGDNSTTAILPFNFKMTKTISP